MVENEMDKKTTKSIKMASVRHWFMHESMIQDLNDSMGLSSATLEPASKFIKLDQNVALFFRVFFLIGW